MPLPLFIGKTPIPIFNLDFLKLLHTLFSMAGHFFPIVSNFILEPVSVWLMTEMFQPIRNFGGTFWSIVSKNQFKNIKKYI